MARANSSLCFLGFLLCIMFAYSSSENSLWTGQKQEKTWCVALGSTPGAKLQGFLEFCCSKLSCAEINPGGSCYAPDTLRDHASYALNLYFRINGECNPDLGCQTTVNPSHDNCYYP